MFSSEVHATPLIQWYSSKVDGWIAAVLMVPPMAVTYVMASGLWVGDINKAGVGAAAGLFVAMLYRSLILPIRYGIGEDCLIVCAGLTRRVIQTALIDRVCPSLNPLSSPALSLDRIRVQYRSGLLGMILISPEPRAQFLSELSKRANLDRNGDCWERASTEPNASL